jgi:uncharacterized OsmC-like protein
MDSKKWSNLMKISLELIEKNQIVAKARQHTLNLWTGDTTEREKGFFASELLIMGLGSCMMGTLLNFSVNQGYEINRIQFEMEYEESQFPSHISKINVNAEIEGKLSTKEIAQLKRAATHCKIHNTLMKMPEINFNILH